MAAKTARPRVRTRSSPELELPQWRKDIKILKKFFRSYLWKYPVHAFIGEVVKAQHYMTDIYQHRPPEEIELKNQIIFNYYCHMISELFKAYHTDFETNPEDTAYRLNFDLPLSLPPPLKDRKDLAIPMSACSYLVAVYNYESFKYITASYAMDLKQYCLDAIEKRMLIVAKKLDSVATYEKIDYIHKKAKDFVEEQLSYSMLKDKSILTWCIKCTTPVPFVNDKKLTSKEIPVMPAHKHKWEEYFLKIYDATLSSLLDKQKLLYDKEHSKKLKRCNREVVDLYFTKLRNILSSTSMTQEEISKGLVPCTSPIIMLMRSALQRTI